MNLQDLCDIYGGETEGEDREGRTVRTRPLVASAVPCRLAALPLARRQREYGQELEASHELWMPVRYALDQQAQVEMRRCPSDPSMVGIRFAVKTLSQPQGRYRRAVLGSA